MSGNKVVLDSNIIIYLSKGLLNIEDISERYDSFYISIITILATAKFLDCPLMTRNVDDFQDILEEVNIVDPFGGYHTEVEEEEEISPI